MLGSRRGANVQFPISDLRFVTHTLYTTGSGFR